MHTKGKAMTDKETAEHLRRYANESHMPFSWPTDACGYEQHIRFVRHRNDNWRGGNQDEWKQFVLDYANAMELADSDRSIKIVSRWIDDIEAAPQT